MAQATRWEVVDDERHEAKKDAGPGRYNSAQNLRWIAEMLDSRYRVFGVRVGWDAILGLIPGFGDLTTNVAAFYIMLQASNIGAPTSVVLRMGLNLLIDNLFDSIPLLGNFADIFWRANTRNVVLLERYLENPRKAAASSRWVVGFTVMVVLASALFCAALSIYFGMLLLGWITGSGGW